MLAKGCRREFQSEMYSERLEGDLEPVDVCGTSFEEDSMRGSQGRLCHESMSGRRVNESMASRRSTSIDDKAPS